MSLITGLLAIILGYFLGSIPSAYLAGRLKGKDLARGNDGGLGTSLSYHKLGPAYGVMVGFIDLSKGILTVIVVRVLGMPISVVLLAGLAAVAGHNWSVFLGFKGGRGTMVAYGVMVSLAFWGLILALCLAGIFLTFTKKPTLATVVGMALLSVELQTQNINHLLAAAPWEPNITPWLVILPITLLIPGLLKYVQIREKEFLPEEKHVPTGQA